RLAVCRCRVADLLRPWSTCAGLLPRGAGLLRGHLAPKAFDLHHTIKLVLLAKHAYIFTYRVEQGRLPAPRCLAFLRPGSQRIGCGFLGRQLFLRSRTSGCIQRSQHRSVLW
ncbi:unnamed protein product, partial [Heterosigma akashiwo]